MRADSADNHGLQEGDKQWLLPTKSWTTQCFEALLVSQKRHCHNLGDECENSSGRGDGCDGCMITSGGVHSSSVRHSIICVGFGQRGPNA